MWISRAIALGDVDEYDVIAGVRILLTCTPLRLEVSDPAYLEREKVRFWSAHLMLINMIMSTGYGSLVLFRHRRSP